MYWFDLVFYSFKTFKKKALHRASFGRYSLRLLTLQTRVQGSSEHSDFWAKVCFRCSLRLSVSTKLWAWGTVISGPCTRIFQEWSFKLRRKSFKVFFFFVCLVTFLSNFSKIMVYKRRIGHSQNQYSPRALQLPSFEAKSTQSKASWHCQRASQEHRVCCYYFECIQLFLRCHWTLLSLAFGALTLKQIDSVLKKAWILFRALNEENWSWNRLENLLTLYSGVHYFFWLLQVPVPR